MNLSNRSNVNNAPMMLETLESRQLMSASTFPAVFPEVLPPVGDGTLVFHGTKAELGNDGVLRITGTDFGDKVTVRHEKGKLTVTSGFFAVKQTFKTTDVTRIEANLGGGDDVLAVRGDFDIPMNVNGDAGNDRLTGGSAGDRIDGGAGEDVITGRQGIDVLIGGTGRDVIEAFDGFTFAVFSRSPVRTGGSRDEIFADDGEKDVIRHDSGDRIHADSVDKITNLTNIRVETLELKVPFNIVEQLPLC